MALPENQSENPSGVSLADHPKAKKEIDLQALAERILRLLKEDARIERERQGLRPWTKKV